jgi:plasmid stability protein
MAALCLRAAKNGHSVDSEARQILRQAVATDRANSASAGLGSRIAALFADLDEVPSDAESTQ